MFCKKRHGQLEERSAAANGEVYFLCSSLPCPQDPPHVSFAAPSCAHFGQPDGMLGFEAAVAIHELLRIVVMLASTYPICKPKLESSVGA